MAKSLKHSCFSHINLNYGKYQKKINEYEKYCSGGQRLKVKYITPEGTEVSLMADPIEIKYIKNKVFFRVCNPLTAQVQDISFDYIKTIQQLPSKTNTTKLFSSTTFCLKNRLAKAYKLHEGERLLQVKSDGSLVVLNQNEDRNLLMHRLMRYGENCEIILPKSLREEMHQLIKSTLANYSV